MKFLIDNWMLIAIALASGGMLLWPLISSGMAAGSLSAAGAVQLINRDKAVIIHLKVRSNGNARWLRLTSAPTGRWRLPKSSVTRRLNACRAGSNRGKRLTFRLRRPDNLPQPIDPTRRFRCPL